MEKEGEGNQVLKWLLMEFDILWHYRFPHDGWEYDDALKELHAAMPEGINDPYEKEGAQ